ncbi:serine protease inhibitor ecotin [Rosenbergiella australiborealis]|uniref:Serine protease inhibitor ecotin n=1 Tax=Rosenbergiella australiborealis TaxID=1544696 RepID=A0ABS5T279_9GAMM|nr:serine protease inhibitor ecotin [Rosenbergiella australiborealis]MBT0726416.1 serine protease inhibitor ecotin [Rosenbergiella australiborealis]
MKKFIVAALCISGWSLSFGAFCATTNNQHPLNAYPESLPGLQRHVIQLPAVGREDDQQVELIIGKIEEVDCNSTSLLGSLSVKPLSGWGYDYYQVAIKPGLVSTKMACLEQAKQKKFITLPLTTAQRFVRYNSKLPIVIYAPHNIEVKYRVWQASATLHTADKK